MDSKIRATFHNVRNIAAQKHCTVDYSLNLHPGILFVDSKLIATTLYSMINNTTGTQCTVGNFHFSDHN